MKSLDLKLGGKSGFWGKQFSAEFRELYLCFNLVTMKGVNQHPNGRFCVCSPFQCIPKMFELSISKIPMVSCLLSFGYGQTYTCQE